MSQNLSFDQQNADTMFRYKPNKSLISHSVNVQNTKYHDFHSQAKIRAYMVRSREYDAV